MVKRKVIEEELDGADYADGLSSGGSELDSGPEDGSDLDGSSLLEEPNAESEEATRKKAKKDNASREAHASQKDLLKARKQAKPNSSMISKAKKIWDHLRQKKVAAKERKRLVDDLVETIRGHVCDIVFKHDASRIIQTAIKYGNNTQREAIMDELKGHIVELAKSPYGKFLAVKLLFYGSPKIREQVYDELAGQICRLIRHKEAAYVVEDAYRDFSNAKQKARIIQEFFGPEYSVFKQQSKEPISIEELLKQSPEKRNSVMKNLWDTLAASIAKGSIGFSILHRALLLYVSHANDPEFRECLETVRDLVPEFVHTKDGSEAAMIIIARSTAKDRKAILKALKPYWVRAAKDEYGNLVVITAIDAVDDTVLMSKLILSETKDNLVELLSDKFARRPFLYLILGRDSRYFPKHVCEQMERMDHFKQSTSKKDDTTRRNEVLSALSPHLLRIVAESTDSMLAESLSAQMLAEILLYVQGDKEPALESVVAAVSGDPSKEGHPLKNAFVSRTIKALVQNGHWDKEENKIKEGPDDLRFASRLLQPVCGHPVAWSTGDGGFVVANMLERLSGNDLKQLRKNLLPRKGEIKSSGQGGNKGAKVVADLVDKQS